MSFFINSVWQFFVISLHNKIFLWRKNLEFSLGQGWGHMLPECQQQFAGCFGIPPPTNWSQTQVFPSLFLPSVKSVSLSTPFSQTECSLASYKAVYYDGAPLGVPQAFLKKELRHRYEGLHCSKSRNHWRSSCTYSSLSSCYVPHRCN